MHFSSALFGLAALVATSVNAQAGALIEVEVGPGGKLEYSPNNIIAPVGTQIQFSFNPKNHTVTQSSFADPCHPLAAGGFFSGFVPTTASPSSTTFTITVNNTTPIWFYCAQTVGNHCQSGMLGAINAPTAGNTLDAFIALAAKANTSTAPPEAGVGGILANNAGTATVSASSSAVISAVSTMYTLSTYTSNGNTYTPTVGATTVFETIIVLPTAVTAGGASSTSSTTAQATKNAASELSAQLFGVAAVGLGALAML